MVDIPKNITKPNQIGLLILFPMVITDTLSTPHMYRRIHVCIYRIIIFSLLSLNTAQQLYELLMLYFDLRPGRKCHSKVMHGKEEIHSNGSYERKSRGRKLADKMGQAKKFPWYSQRLTHRKRMTSELHDSYFRLMTIKHAISKIEWAIEWTLNYYIT